MPSRLTPDEELAEFVGTHGWVDTIARLQWLAAIACEYGPSEPAMLAANGLEALLKKFESAGYDPKAAMSREN